ncbi:MAG: AraC family transcriptional regulator [Pseudomonadales bacterium]|nr:AraC family transcriptional regulator [Pseudomonadales bacterium]
MKTVFEYTQRNVLVIPRALYGMRDVELIMQSRNSGIFHKCLEQDLVDVEFYSTMPCFVYIESGKEILTNCKNEHIELSASNGIFLPQGACLNSDFVKSTDRLSAYLVFFDGEVVSDFIRGINSFPGPRSDGPDHCLVTDPDTLISNFFKTIQPTLTEPGYLSSKLLELLHLIAWREVDKKLPGMLLKMSQQLPKRNLEQLLAQPDVLHLSVTDLAHLSGRSLSSFNRDFKQTFQTTPHKWLTDRRLFRAKELIDANGFTVTAAAAELGYENVSNFIKAFKVRFGHTPKQNNPLK